MNGRPRHWLNPHYQRSETEASTCRLDCRSHHQSCQNLSSSILLGTENSMKKVESRVRSILTCLPKSWAKLNTFTNSLTSILTTRSEPKDEKDVVMEGVLPTTKASLMSFLKGMGLRPKVELVGQETIISADMSVIHDESLKRRFLDVIKMQVIETPAATSANSNIETTEPSVSSMHVPPQNDKKNPPFFGRKRHKSTDSLAPELFKPDKPRLSQEDPHHKRQEMQRTSIDSLPPGPFKPDKPNGTLPPGPYRTEKQIRRESAMRRNSKTKPGELPPGPFLPKHPRESGMSKKSNHEDEHNLSQKSVESQSSHEDHDGARKNVSFAMHQKQYEYTTPQIDCWPHQPSNQTPIRGPDKKENENSGKKPKKFRVMKHLRRWIRGSKRAVSSHPSASEVVENREDCRALRRTPSEKPKKEIGKEKESGNRRKKEISTVYQGGGGSTRISELAPQVHQERNFKDYEKQTVRAAADIKPLEAFDGSISMPVLFTPDKSCFKTKIPTKQENPEGSKSSTRARKVLEEEPTTYSVVGNSAAIHIAKNRIRLEGKDTKYGSILHKDEHFDDHFKVLQENGLQDIEHQVNKVKERIMFARAIDSVACNMSEDAPEVNLKALLWPEEKDKRGIAKKNQVDVVTKSSFYQKFLASMNILKCTNRTDACDRSVMTDEPLSRTYAEFIAATVEMGNKNHDDKKCCKPVKKRPMNCERSSVSIGDSSCDQPSRSYMTRICQCWEPLLPSKRDQMEQSFHRFEPLRTDDEKILKCVVNKVIDSSRNKKKGYIKTDMTM